MWVFCVRAIMCRGTHCLYDGAAEGAESLAAGPKVHRTVLDVSHITCLELCGCVKVS